MRKVSAFLVLLMLAISLSLISAADNQTYRLVRGPRSSRISAGLLEARPIRGERNKARWELSLHGHRLVFDFSSDTGSLFTAIMVKIDDGDPIRLSGMPGVAEGRMLIDFSPVRIALGDYQFPLAVRLEKYRSDVATRIWDQRTKSSASGGTYGSPNLPSVVYESAAADWLLSAGNADAFSAPMQFGRKWQGRIWLIDADLDGEFGAFADGGHGDLLAWEYEKKSLFYGTRHESGAKPLEQKTALAGKRYAVRLERFDADTILVELMEP